MPTRVSQTTIDLISAHCPRGQQSIFKGKTIDHLFKGILAAFTLNLTAISCYVLGEVSIYFRIQFIKITNENVVCRYGWV